MVHEGTFTDIAKVVPLHLVVPVSLHMSGEGRALAIISLLCIGHCYPNKKEPTIELSPDDKGLINHD